MTANLKLPEWERRRIGAVSQNDGEAGCPKARALPAKEEVFLLDIPFYRTIPPTDTPLPNWSETPAPSPASSDGAPSGPKIPSWRRSFDACRHSTECVPPSLHGWHTPPAAEHRDNRWGCPTTAQTASAARAIGHSPGPAADIANSAREYRRGAAP